MNPGASGTEAMEATGRGNRHGACARTAREGRSTGIPLRSAFHTERPPKQTPVSARWWLAVAAALAVLATGPSRRAFAFRPPGPLPAARKGPAALRNNNSSNNSNNKNSSSNGGDGAGTEKDMDVLTKSSWYAVEWFGKAFGRGNPGSDRDGESEKGGERATDRSAPPVSLAETLDRIGADNDRSYFLSGDMDVEIYEKDCVFADPFVSFAGLDRFVENLENLGSFVTRYETRVLPPRGPGQAGNEPETTTTTTRLMVKLELNLPWKPVLAWPWGVTYTIDKDTFLVTKHVESWEIAPLEGVKMIFRKPTARF